ncbi:hypothetical protein ACFY0B_29485 [Streptomyces sp. NPDC001797]|uniref:hypothetical protein n=1 Tax=Streptomyces sp. NPDC001797 TaxID=3364610 RepID=UPI00367D7357
MTAPDSVPLHALAEASPDLLRAMVRTFADALYALPPERVVPPLAGRPYDLRHARRG